MQCCIALQKIAQALWHREHPLARRQRWKYVIDKVRGGLDHPARVARWAYATPLAGKCDQEVVSAIFATSACEAESQDSTFQVTAKCLYYICVRRLVELCLRERQPGFKIRLNSTIPQRFFGVAALIAPPCGTFDCVIHDGYSTNRFAGGSSERWKLQALLP